MKVEQVLVPVRQLLDKWVIQATPDYRDENLKLYYGWNETKMCSKFTFKGLLQCLSKVQKNFLI